ncbi:hypothetical protein ACMFMG_004574 [Clarireedia jacksonii]
MLPIEELAPRYRDEPQRGEVSLVPPPPAQGTEVLFESPVTGSPELSIQIGHVPFESNVTGNTEYLPCAVSIMATPGRDLQLMDIAKDRLEKVGRLTSVFAGKWMFGKPEGEQNE